MTTPLGDCVELAYGRPLPKSKRHESGNVPVYGANGVIAYTDAPLYDSPSIIVGRKGSAGALQYSEGSSWALDVAYYVKADQSICNLRYLYYFLMSQNLTALATGVKPGINRNHVYALEMPLPLVDEQQRIAGLLDRITDRSAEYSRKLDQIRADQSALRRAYIDAVFESLDARSEALAEVCDVFTDGDWIESKDQSPAGIRLVQTGNIGNGVFRDRLDKARWISLATFDRLRCTELLPGDVVFSRLPEPVGRACLIPDIGTNMITAVDCTIARPNHSVLLPRFLILYASSSAYFHEVQSMVTGTTRDRISRKNLGGVRIPIPSITTQQELLSAADRAETGFSSLESALEGGLRYAEELASSVLEAAFRGEL